MRKGGSYGGRYDSVYCYIYSGGAKQIMHLNDPLLVIVVILFTTGVIVRVLIEWRHIHRLKQHESRYNEKWIDPYIKTGYTVKIQGKDIPVVFENKSQISTDEWNKVTQKQVDNFRFPDNE